MIFVLLLGCRLGVQSSDSSDSSDSSNSYLDTGNVSDPSGSVEAIDIDEDGFVEGEDCDDWDPAIHPNAEEIFDYIDNNCDGIIDYDGRFSGSISMEAVAIYEGTPYSFSQSCSGVMVRERGATELEIICSIDTSQENADILLGQEIRIEGSSTTLHSPQWQDDWMVSSSDGWDTPISSQALWSALEINLGERIEIEGGLDSFSLDMNITGALQRE